MVKKRFWLQRTLILSGVFACGLGFAHVHFANAQSARHGQIGEGHTLSESGQSAFAAIQEIAARLMADETTDWQRVDLEKLRQHLIDMNNVTLRADISTREVANGASFKVTSTDGKVTNSIRRMAQAHAVTFQSPKGWAFSLKDLTNGVELVATGRAADDARQIRGLGFIGLLSLGAHHKAHHLAISSGINPHAH